MIIIGACDLDRLEMSKSCRYLENHIIIHYKTRASRSLLNQAEDLDRAERRTTMTFRIRGNYLLYDHLRCLAMTENRNEDLDIQVKVVIGLCSPNDASKRSHI